MAIVVLVLASLLAVSLWLLSRRRRPPTEGKYSERRLVANKSPAEVSTRTLEIGPGRAFTPAAQPAGGKEQEACKNIERAEKEQLAPLPRAAAESQSFESEGSDNLQNHLQCCRRTTRRRGYVVEKNGRGEWI
jgi:hypothetical protein